MVNHDYLEPSLRQHELAVIFNVRHPVDGQIENVCRVLQHEGNRDRKKTWQDENCPHYLCLLNTDAMGEVMMKLLTSLYG